MKRLTVSVYLALALAAPLAGAQQSLPDSNPECMQVNGPDCVLKSATVPYRVSAPPGLIVTPPVVPPVIVVAPVGTERAPAAPVGGIPAVGGTPTEAAPPASRAPRY